MVEARIAGAEVVECDLDPQGLKASQDGFRRGQIADQGRLGDFDFEPMRREPYDCFTERAAE